MALSFHSVFEGLAIGIQPNLSQLMSIFIAVIAHKGMQFYSTLSISLKMLLKIIDFANKSYQRIEKLYHPPSRIIKMQQHKH